MYLLGWPQRDMEALLARLDAVQRGALGFPRPGSSYWTEERLDAVEARFSWTGMDLTIYRRALRESGGGTRRRIEELNLELAGLLKRASVGTRRSLL